MTKSSNKRTYIWGLPSWPKLQFEVGPLALPLANARRVQGELLGLVRALQVDRSELATEAAIEAMASEVVSNSAIEGVKLDPGLVRASMLYRLGVERGGIQPGASKRVDPVVGVLTEAVRGFDLPLTEERIFGWHKALFPTAVGDDGWPILVGQLRGPGEMQVVTQQRSYTDDPIVHFEAPGHERLEKEMAEFLGWFNDPPQGLDGLLRAGLAHLWFVTIHPLADGNGRITRTITDLALAQDEQSPNRFYSLSMQIMRNKDAYYDALESAQRGTLDATGWLLWFLKQAEAAMRHGLAEIQRVVTRSRFWAHANTLELNERQRTVLHQILGPGVLEYGVVSRSHYLKILRNDTGTATATRDLKDLVEKGLMVPLEGKGRSSSYRVLLECFETPGK